MKMFKKTLSVLLAVVMVFGCLSVVSFAANTTDPAAPEKIEVSLRVEGIDSCFYYQKLKVPAGASVFDVITIADKGSKKIDIEKKSGAFIQCINGLENGSKTKKGWDGWSFTHNGVIPNVGADSVNVSAGDEIVFFYGDPWGDIGMQIPKVNLERIDEGYISFTSEVTDFSTESPVVKEVPVKGYTLTWGYDNGKTVEIKPDKDGVCQIKHQHLGWGDHSVQIEKYDANTGLPMVLRYADDYTVRAFTPETFGDYIVNIFVTLFELLNESIGMFII